MAQNGDWKSASLMRRSLVNTLNVISPSNIGRTEMIETVYVVRGVISMVRRWWKTDAN